MNLNAKFAANQPLFRRNALLRHGNSEPLAGLYRAVRQAIELLDALRGYTPHHGHGVNVFALLNHVDSGRHVCLGRLNHLLRNRRRNRLLPPGAAGNNRKEQRRYESDK